MRGVSNRTRGLVGPRDDAARIANAMNRLPFAFVGVVGTKASATSAAATGTWEAFDINADIDYDGMMQSTQQAKVLSGCEGVYQVALSGTTSSGSASIRLTKNGTAVLTTAVSGVSYVDLSHPVELNVGDIIAWQFNTANLAYQLMGGTQVSFYRLGLLP